MVDALKKCEIERVTKTLKKTHGCSEAELRRRYADERICIIEITQSTSGEDMGGIRVMQGGAVPVEYDDWIISKADQPTLQALNDVAGLLSFGQIIANAPPAPRAAMILYEAEAADSIAAVIAGYLADHNVIYGVKEAQFDRAYDALRMLFGENDGEGHSFRDRCRFAYWAQFSIYDPRVQERIEAQIAELRESGRKIVSLSETELADAAEDPLKWTGPFKTPVKHIEIGLRVVNEDGSHKFVSPGRLQSAPREKEES
ncbi:MAG: hypothetical protein ACYDA1_08055 [Vulcanimicrobiaceae bacterium]